MKKICFIVSLVLIACNGTKSTVSNESNNISEGSTVAKTDVANQEDVAKTLQFLTSDDLEGRNTGSSGIEKASYFLEDIFKKNGVQPYFKTYRDTLSNYDLPAYNIVGYLEGNDPKLKNEFVVIGAHYDHIGRIQAVNGDDIGNGANDNASGTTAVTEVVKYFAKHKTNRRSIIFAFFSAEEKGLLGSKHLAKKLKEQNIDLYFMFNYEMIGVKMNREDMLLYLTGFGKSNMAKKMNEYAGENLIGYIPVETQYQLFRASDNYPFYTEFEIPAQTVSTFDFENFQFYHQPDDEFELMNTTHMTNVINKTIPVLEKMMNAATKEIQMN
ncbi:MAG: peptidase M28 [Flavobacterium sp.]|uniref:M28 family metallopeptidase n=1 Tax=Flavobacterium sp. TaxID=239 RepID=UPI000C41547A|nr:M20/M25/M40 family metallo-hydrolase [Flavobacterium sp.]MBF04825.1 peptidase M28 [Flavobacterium sp.]|tara:strand:- start:4362 stop:5342 length:981 start_codon:yes stop_codon:yes gene_type:complete